MMTAMIERGTLLRPTAAPMVRAMEPRKMVDAIHRLLSNIVLSWRMGPSRNVVLSMGRCFREGRGHGARADVPAERRDGSERVKKCKRLEVQERQEDGALRTSSSANSRDARDARAVCTRMLSTNPRQKQATKPYMRVLALSLHVWLNSVINDSSSLPDGPSSSSSRVNEVNMPLTESIVRRRKRKKDNEWARQGLVRVFGVRVKAADSCALLSHLLNHQMNRLVKRATLLE